MKLAAAWAVALTPVLLIACGGNNSYKTTIVVTSAVSSPTPPVAARNDPGATVGAVVEACREKDVERLRALVPASVTEDEIASMLAGGSDVQLLNQSVPDAVTDSASITVSLRVTNGSGSNVVQRTWELQRSVGGVWRLTALPECF